MITIGLFGTCGNSKWRDSFIEGYKSQGINYYNPHVEEWDPELAKVEAHHLVNDEIILFPITSETYATGSLAETGFSAMSAIRARTDRFVIILIDQKLEDKLVLDNPGLAKESIRARTLVREHLKKLNAPNVFFVDTLKEMYDTSIELHSIAKILRDIRERHKRIE